MSISHKYGENLPQLCPLPYISDHLKLAVGYQYLGWAHFKDPSQNPKGNCGLCVVLGLRSSRTITFSQMFPFIGKKGSKLFAKNVKVVVLLLPERWWPELIIGRTGGRELRQVAANEVNSEQKIFSAHKNGHQVSII